MVWRTGVGAGNTGLGRKPHGALMNRAKEQNRLLLLHKSLLSTYCVQSSSEGI